MLREGDRVGIVCGREIRATKKPFGEILALVTRGREAENVFVEAGFLADAFGANLIHLHRSCGALTCSLSGEVEDVDVEEALELLKRFEVDLVVTNLPEERKYIFSFRSPVLFAKGRRSYGRVLVIANTVEFETVVPYVSALSEAFDTEVMFFESARTVPPDVKVSVRVARYNPLVEVVSAVRGNFDLIVFSARNDLGNLGRSTLWKIAKTGASTMVIP